MLSLINIGRIWEKILQKCNKKERKKIYATAIQERKNEVLTTIKDPHSREFLPKIKELAKSLLMAQMNDPKIAETINNKIFENTMQLLLNHLKMSKIMKINTGRRTKKSKSMIQSSLIAITKILVTSLTLPKLA